MNRLADLLLIKEGEGGRTSYFILFFLLMGAGLAIGKGSADALFIKRYGVENFPYVYLVLSMVLAATCIFYAAYVDRLSSERMFRIIFAIQMLVLLVTTLVIRLHDNDLVYPVYYLVYSISSEMLLVHGALYIGQNYHTLQAKRLTPLIFAGYQVGMMTGGAGLMFLVPQIGLGNAPLVWAALLVAASACLLFRHRAGASPYYFNSARSSGPRLVSALRQIGEGVEFTVRSRLLRNASYALFFMVITYYMLSYTVHTIYTGVFDDEESLAKFFGILVIVTNVLAMLMQMFVTGRIIERFGIRRSNTIYPATTAISFALLLVWPTLLTALFASFNRETIMPAVRTPTRQMFFNVLPDNIKGRARAISVAIVMPLALFCCGGLIILLKRFEGIEPVAAAGVVCGLAYLLFAVKMGRDYIVTLINSMREKLYLPLDECCNYTDDSPELIAAMKQGLDSDDADVSLSYAKALVLAHPQEAAGIILERIRTLDVKTADQMVKMIDVEMSSEHLQELDRIARSGDRHLEATVFEIMLAAESGQREQRIGKALHSDSPRLRVSAVHAAFLYAGAELQNEACTIWKTLLAGTESERLASLRLLPLLNDDVVQARGELLESCLNMLPDLMNTADRQRSLSVMEALQLVEQRLPEQLGRLFRPCLVDDAPSVRAAATGLLRLICDGEVFEAALWRALADGHPLVRQAALCVIMNDSDDYAGQFHEWLLENRKGTPRAQLTLLIEVIESGASNVMLEELADSKLHYSASVLCAIDRLQESADDEASLLLLTALRERLEQSGDLVLLCLQPALGNDLVAVIRAGLKSRDERHIANAIEAMGGLDHDMAGVIASLVKGDCAAVLAGGYGKIFERREDVVGWCAGLDDWWIRLCGENVMNKRSSVVRA